MTNLETVRVLEGVALQHGFVGRLVKQYIILGTCHFIFYGVHVLVFSINVRDHAGHGKPGSLRILFQAWKVMEFNCHFLNFIEN